MINYAISLSRIVMLKKASVDNTNTYSRILECGLDEKKTSTHSMEMSKSTSSISSRMSVLESFEEVIIYRIYD